MPVHSDAWVRAFHDMLVLGSNERAIYDGARGCDHVGSVAFYSNVRAENVAALNHLSYRLLVIGVFIGSEVLLLRGCSVGDVLQDIRLPGLSGIQLPALGMLNTHIDGERRNGWGSMFVVTLLDGTDSNRFGQSQ